MLEIAFRHAFPGRDFDVAITAPTSGTTVLFGPSGAGKSTIAAVVTGLLRPHDAHVAIDGMVLQDSARGVFVPPERRRIGVVFQDARLFPHLSVAANLRYGLDRAAGSGIGWNEVIGLLDIAGLLARRPATLSGGEKQRVAIGRALLSQPRLLVMDEPLAGLEAPRRAEILPFLSRLRERLALPILYVSHAVDEVARLADTLVLIDNGRVTASGPLTELAASAKLPLGSRRDAGAVLDCMVAGHLPNRQLTRLALAEAPGLELLIPALPLVVGHRLRVRVPANEVILATSPPVGISVQNIIAGQIAAIIYPSAGQAMVELRLGRAPFLANVTLDAITRLNLTAGAQVLVLIKSVTISVLG